MTTHECVSLFNQAKDAYVRIQNTSLNRSDPGLLQCWANAWTGSQTVRGSTTAACFKLWGTTNEDEAKWFSPEERVIRRDVNPFLERVSHLSGIKREYVNYLYSENGHVPLDAVWKRFPVLESNRLLFHALCGREDDIMRDPRDILKRIIGQIATQMVVPPDGVSISDWTDITADIVRKGYVGSTDWELVIDLNKVPKDVWRVSRWNIEGYTAWKGADYKRKEDRPQKVPKKPKVVPPPPPPERVVDGGGGGGGGGAGAGILLIALAVGLGAAAFSG